MDTLKKVEQAHLEAEKSKYIKGKDKDSRHERKMSKLLKKRKNKDVKRSDADQEGELDEQAQIDLEFR
mgnify:CR=1 FL=1